MRPPRIEGFGHVDLTVVDGERSAEWWERVLGFRLVMTAERSGFKIWSMVHPSGLAVGLVAHAEPISDGFDERAVGLDHLALRVSNRAALDEWVEYLDRIGVSHSGVKEEIGGPLITLRDLDHIQLELWAYEPDSLPVALQRPND